MRLSLKTKFTLATSLLVLAVVALVSGLYVARLMRQTLREADDRAHFIALQILQAWQSSLLDAAQHGEAPASNSPADMHEYIRRVLDNSSPLNSVMESAIVYSPTIYEITITDKDGIVLVSTDAAMRGQKVAMRPPISSLVRAKFFQQINMLLGPPQVYDFSLPIALSTGPFGDIRIGLNSALIRDELVPTFKSAGIYALAAVLISTFLAFVVSRASLAPIERISKQLDRISAGEFDLEPVVERGDELGVVSTKIVGIGKQLRDVREIFSTLRENLDQIMSGLEDGLLLFNASGRAVLISPSVEKFLGVPLEQLRGSKVSEIFPPGSPLREVLGVRGDQIEPLENAEIALEGPSGPQRIGVSAQVVREQGVAMGSLVTLRDVESLERIGNQLQVSERLAALGRVTAGVAHEVKNPLNSMRLWLEVLKANMPIDPEPQQAVKMLDNEIDRLDRAVKTFLNFTKPVELNLEETDLRAFLIEVADAARPSIDKAFVDLAVDVPPVFPPVMLDQQLMHQAVLNLLLNASEFTPPAGRIMLSLRRSGEYAEIAVSDTGKGISPEDQLKIFQLFFTTRAGGSGIGLANTFRFVQIHNGQIEFESELGRGTTFRIHLPLARAFEPAGKLRDFSQPFAEEKR
ncbi:MAG: ATP-binding protein [Candidatus Acidiferrales bacterium]|jgi:signal transduction histidine kinase/HAMP domain-containing protein